MIVNLDFRNGKPFKVLKIWLLYTTITTTDFISAYLLIKINFMENIISTCLFYFNILKSIEE